MPSCGRLLPRAILVILIAAAVLAASTPRVELILHLDGSVSLRGSYEGPMPGLPSDIAAFSGTLSIRASAEPGATKLSLLFDGVILPRVLLFEDFALALEANVTPAAGRVLRSFTQDLSLSYGSANNLSASIRCSSVAHVRDLAEESRAPPHSRPSGPTPRS